MGNEKTSKTLKLKKLFGIIAGILILLKLPQYCISIVGLYDAYRREWINGPAAQFFCRFPCPDFTSWPSALCGGVIFNHTLRTFKYTFNFLRRTMLGCILSIPKDCQLARKGLLDYGNLRLEIANASNSSKSFYCHGSLLLPFATASKTSMQRVLIPCESVMFSRSATERR